MKNDFGAKARRSFFCLAALLCAGAAAVSAGCSSIEKHKYVFWGDIVGVKPDILQDHWSDYGPFLPNDSSKKMRRGKAGVLRFYREKEMTHSVPVDGSLIVYVYHGNDEGVELTAPMAKLVLEPEKLEKLRKFDKKTGYTYHVWLDLGEIDLPEENISILAVFTDAKTKEQVASGVTYTRIGGDGIPANEAAQKDGTKQDKSMPSPEEWARRYRKENGGTLIGGENDLSVAPDGETPNKPNAPKKPSNTAEPTVIELSDGMSRRLNASEETPGESNERRYAAYLDKKNAADSSTVANGWKEAPPDMNFNAPVLVAQKGTAAPAPGTSAKGVGSAKKKLTFEDLRSITGPTSEQEAYFTQGTVAPDGSVNADSPFSKVNANQ